MEILCHEYTRPVVTVSLATFKEHAVMHHAVSCTDGRTEVEACRKSLDRYGKRSGSIQGIV